MLTRLILQRGEGKLFVASTNIRTRRKRAEKASFSSKESLKSILEVAQAPSPLVEIEEVQIAQEANVIEEVQAREVELESKAIMLGYQDTNEHYEQEDVKRDLK